MDITKYKADAKQIVNNYKITKGIPIDTRYIIQSISDINNDIPFKLRYPGLRFFASDTEITNHEGVVIKTGAFFRFDVDLSTPILDTLFPDVAEIYINFLGTEETEPETYANLLDKLNDLNMYYGMIVHIRPLDICVIYTEDAGWKYAFGTYKIPYEVGFTTFNAIPEQLREYSVPVQFDNGSYGIISSNLSVVDKVQVLTNINDAVLTENGYYLVNGILYFTVNGALYQISDKLKVFTNLNLIEGDNIIQHDLVSTNILSFLRINNIDNLEDDLNGFEPIKHKIVDSTHIIINSKFPQLTCDLILLVKF